MIFAGGIVIFVRIQSPSQPVRLTAPFTQGGLDGCAAYHIKNNLPLQLF